MLPRRGEGAEIAKLWETTSDFLILGVPVPFSIMSRVVAPTFGVPRWLSHAACWCAAGHRSQLCEEGGNVKQQMVRTCTLLCALYPQLGRPGRTLACNGLNSALFCPLGADASERKGLWAQNSDRMEYPCLPSLELKGTSF